MQILYYTLFVMIYEYSVKKGKPIIVMTLDKVVATVKQNVRLVSTVTGEPEPRVEWLVNLRT
jgi:hypothetical protein